PVYSLTGPGMTHPVTFSYHSVRFKTSDHTGAKPSLETLEPGKQFAHGFSLTQWQDVSRTGSYTLSARFEWNGLKAEAQPVTFVVAANTYAAAVLTAAAGVRSRSVFVSWLGQDVPLREDAVPKSKTIGRAVFYLKRPDLGEMRLTDLQSFRTVP